jgi:hypothetical protein
MPTLRTFPTRGLPAHRAEFLAKRILALGDQIAMADELIKPIVTDLASKSPGAARHRWRQAPPHAQRNQRCSAASSRYPPPPA